MRRLPIVLAVALVAMPAAAQFRGPSLSGNAVTVAAARDAPLGDTVTLTGHIINHARNDNYTFSDNSGRIRVEIGSGLWKGRLITPKTRVRLSAEVTLGRYGRSLVAQRLELAP